MSSVPPARSTRVGAFDSMRMGFLVEWIQVRSDGCKYVAKNTTKLLRSAAGSAVAQQYGRSRLAPSLRGIGFETAAATRYICAAGADDDQFVTFNQALGVHGRIATSNANCQQLGNLFGDCQQPGHR